MENMVQIKYVLRPEDYAAFAKFHFKTSRTLRRAILRQQLIWTAGIIVSMIGWIRHPENWVYIYLAVASVSGLVWATFGEPRRYVRNTIKMRGEGKRGNEPTSVEMGLETDGLRIVSSNGQTHLLWSGLDRIELLQDHCLAYVSGNQALIIPRATVTEGDYDALAAELTSRFEKSRVQTQEPK